MKRGARLPGALHADLDRLAQQVSRSLRRDGELAFYGAEDLTPSSFYSRQDAEAAFDGARLVVDTARPVVEGRG